MNDPIAQPELTPRAVAVSAVLLLASACAQEQPAPPESRPVTAVQVSVGRQAGEVAYSGEVQPRYVSALSFRVPGKIVARLVDIGDVVEPGQVLARLDPEDQKLNFEAARSQLAAAQADHDQTKADLARYADLLEKKFISEAEFDRRRTVYEVARAQLEQARARLAVAENQAGYTELAADHAGVITSIDAEAGQVVSAGQPVLRLARTEQKEVQISVPENRLAELRNAKEIDIVLWASPDRRYRGRVREVSPAADAVTRTYAARISLLDADASVRIGMTAAVYLRGLSRADSIELPATAVFQQDGRAAVWRIDPATSQVQAVPVEVDRFVEDRVVLRSGLNAGDLVVRAGVHKLFEGEKVRVLGEDGA
ncbi:MAG: efflux RND transporter periplasmic adaptor subunit [Burkholderiales bacterium]